MEIKRKTKKMLEKVIRKLARMAEDEVRRPSVNSSISEIPGLVRLAKQACRDQYVQRDIDHLQEGLNEGNYQAGIGIERLNGTPVWYMRGRNGGRLYFIPGQGGYNIVAKSGKNNQNRVISQLKSKYNRAA